MGFKLRNEASEWFGNVRKQKPFSTDFDIYYFCLMAGLAAGRRKQQEKDSDTLKEFVSYFVSPYVNSKKLILGLLLYVENKRMGVEMSEKKDVQKTINELLDPDDPSSLTSRGQEILNEYASGGFDVITEELGEKPFNVEEFLVRYSKMITFVASKNSSWWGTSE